MQPREKLRQALTLDGASALIAFVTAGYPDPDRFLEVLRVIGEAVDAVEIGVPFTDPMADGVTVQRASHAALQHGVSLSWIFAQLGEVTSTAFAVDVVTEPKAGLQGGLFVVFRQSDGERAGIQNRARPARHPVVSELRGPL
jgi:hypothetical protein